MSEPVATEYDSDDLTTAYLAGLHRGGDAAAATITALRARVAELERVGRETADYLRKLEANMLENDADMMLDDCLPPSFHADQIDAALRAKGGDNGDA